MDGVHGLEPWNDRIKIYCLTNLAIPQYKNIEYNTIELRIKEKNRDYQVFSLIA